MNVETRDVFLLEAFTQCRFAQNAVQALNSALEQQVEAMRVRDHAQVQALGDETFRAIHSFLTHASNVSRIFWPGTPPRTRGETRGRYRARSAQDPRLRRASALRAATGIPENHPLRSRQLRDHLEHYDERLDEWATTSASRNLVLDGIGPKGSIVGVAAEDRMRWFDPVPLHMSFRSEEYDLQAMTNAVTDITDKVTKLLVLGRFARMLALYGIAGQAGSNPADRLAPEVR